MNCIDIIEGTAKRLLRIIEHQHEVVPIPTPEYGWENHRFRSPRFRLAHVEIFNQDRFCVVHCCVFPHVNDPSPIYGFDVIAGESKVTGVFMDLSPVVEGNTSPFLQIDVGKARERPEWGEIFSPHWLACRPSPEEMIMIGNEAVRVLVHYLASLGDVGNRDTIVAGQNRYCLNQRKNEHTRRALARLLGPHRAEEFMDQILFPTIN